MDPLVHYTQCPVCGAASFKIVLAVKDYTVSQKEFAIAECNQCTLRFTQDVPDEKWIAPYYKSENYISHTDTSKGLINRLYKVIRKRTLSQKRNLIEKTTGKRSGLLLDVGAGTGGFLNEMRENSWQVRGLEPDEDARLVAKSIHNIQLEESSRLFSLTAGSFDAITMWHVLEHVHALDRYIARLKELLIPGGRLLIAVPNYTSHDANAYAAYWAAYDVPRHLYHFSPKSMKTLIERHGMRIIEIKPMWFDSFYVSLLSSKYKNGSTNWVGAVWTGLVSNINAFFNKEKCSSQIYIIAK